MAGILSSFISVARARFKGAYEASSGAIRSAVNKVAYIRSRKDVFRVSQTGLEDVVGITGAILKVTSDGTLSSAVADVIGDAAVRELREAVEPISRTGRLKDSFRHQHVGDGVIVFSDAPYARTILEEPSRDNPPSAEDLMDWMATKPEFAGLDPKAARRVAFAIRTSIATGVGAGRTGRSDIRRLSPSGQKAYDYVSVAAEQISSELVSMGFNVIREVTGNI